MPVDPGTGLAILGGAIGSVQLATKVLGPSADYLGSELKTWTEKRFANVKRIFEHAERLIDASGESSGHIPPRVLRDILEDGSFRDDKLSSEYYGGILASSKTTVSRDDRGASFTALVGRLTCYQIRAHFVFYSTFQRMFRGQMLELGRMTVRKNCRIFISAEEYDTAMGMERGEDRVSLGSHVITGLKGHSLIEEDIAAGDPRYLHSCFPSEFVFPGPGVVFAPSTLGIELYLWVLGSKETRLSWILNRDLKVPDVGIAHCPNAIAVSSR